MLYVSTKFKELILGASSFASIFNNGRILVYSGAQPASANAPAQGAILAEISTNGTPWNEGGAGGGGLLFAQSGAFVIADSAWRMRVVASGTAGWFRLYAPAADPDALSYAHPRIDGAIGSELILASNVLAAGQSIPVHQFTYTIPGA